MVAVDNATRLTQYIDEQNIVLSKLSQLFEDDKSTKVSSNTTIKLSNLKVERKGFFIKQYICSLLYHHNSCNNVSFSKLGFAVQYFQKF